MRLLQSLLDKLAGLASPQALAAAAIAAQQTTTALQEAIDGRSPFPPWSNDGLPLDHSLPIIQEALAGGHHLALLYYTAGTDRLTRRLVEPYRLETRGDVPYLVGFCHRAQAERVFRVDRMREIAIERGDAGEEEIGRWGD